MADFGADNLVEDILETIPVDIPVAEFDGDIAFDHGLYIAPPTAPEENVTTRRSSRPLPDLVPLF